MLERLLTYVVARRRRMRWRNGEPSAKSPSHDRCACLLTGIFELSRRKPNGSSSPPRRRQWCSAQITTSPRIPRRATPGSAALPGADGPCSTDPGQRAPSSRTNIETSRRTDPATGWSEPRGRHHRHCELRPGPPGARWSRVSVDAHGSISWMLNYKGMNDPTFRTWRRHRLDERRGPGRETRRPAKMPPRST